MSNDCKEEPCELPDELRKVVQELRNILKKDPKTLDLHCNGETTKLDTVYPYDLEGTIKEFAKKRNALTRENYQRVIGLAEIFEHMTKKYFQTDAAKETKMLVGEQTIQIICEELAEQLEPQLIPSDKAKVITSEGSLMTTYEKVVGDTIHLNLDKRDRNKFEGAKFIAISKREGDNQLLSTLKRIQEIPQDLLQFLFPMGRKKVKKFPDRNNWKFTTQGMDADHAKFVRAVSAYHHHQPYILQGCCGSGKSHALAELITTYVKNMPTVKIVVGSVNNVAVNSLMLKVAAKSQKIKMVRYVGSVHETLLPISLSLPGVKFLDQEASLKQFGNSHLYGTTVSKATKLMGPVGLKADLIILDEAASAYESATCALLQGFWDKSKTNVILAGDVYQLPGLALSGSAKALGIQISTMERLMNGDPTYSRRNRQQTSVPSISEFFTTYRGPTEITSLISNYYPVGLVAKPKPEKALKYLNMKNMPEGHVIFHHVEGKQKYYTNKNKSISNPDEEQLIMAYLRVLAKQNKANVQDIMIIPYYNKQNHSIKKAVRNMGLAVTETEDQEAILITSPIRSQGLEKPIVIVSLCQSGNRTLGNYLRDSRQALVALSRASSIMIVIGNKHLISQDAIWQNILEYEIDYNKVGKEFLR